MTISFGPTHYVNDQANEPVGRADQYEGRKEGRQRDEMATLEKNHMHATTLHQTV